MPFIALEGMRFFAKHGFYEEEQILGGEYIVDVTIQSTFGEAAAKDDLYKTINYETVYLICEANMRKPSKLIETVATLISQDIKHQFNNIQEIKVSIKKLNPPLGGRVDAARVELSSNFQKKCPRCGKGMLCYKDKSCWCREKLIFQKTQEQFQVQYNDQCLCKDCLAFFM